MFGPRRSAARGYTRFLPENPVRAWDNPYVWCTMKQRSIYQVVGWLAVAAAIWLTYVDADWHWTLTLIGIALLCVPLHYFATRRLRSKGWEVCGGLIAGFSVLAYSGHDARGLLSMLGPGVVGALVMLAVGVTGLRLMTKSPKKRNAGWFMGQRQHDRG